MSAERLYRNVFKSEVLLISCLLAGQIFLAPLLIDFFPFSTFPMFSDAPERIFIVWPSGKLDSENVQLFYNEFSTYYANPAPKFSRYVPEISTSNLDSSWVDDFNKQSKNQIQVTKIEVGPINSYKVGIVSRTLLR